MSLKRFARFFITSALFVTTAAFASHAQNRLSRGANQPIDEEYSKKIREYTTEPFSFQVLRPAQAEFFS